MKLLVMGGFEQTENMSVERIYNSGLADFIFLPNKLRLGEKKDI